MKYRNTKTGAFIDVKSKLSGGNWQAVEPADSSVEEEIEVEEEELEEEELEEEETEVAPVQPKKKKVTKVNE